MDRQLANSEIIDPSSYTLCAHYPGIAGDGATVTLTCSAYTGLAVSVLIQIPGGHERLTLCEVQVEAAQAVPSEL